MPPFSEFDSIRPEHMAFRYNRVICNVCDNPEPPSDLTFEPRADKKIHVPTSAPVPIRNSHWRHHDPCDLDIHPTIPHGVQVHQDNWFVKDGLKVNIENEINRKADIIEDYQTEQRLQKESLNTLSYIAELKQAQIKLTKQQQQCSFKQTDFVVALPMLPQKPPTGSNNTNKLAHFYRKAKPTAPQRVSFPFASKDDEAKPVVHALSLANAHLTPAFRSNSYQITSDKPTGDKKNSSVSSLGNEHVTPAVRPNKTKFPSGKPNDIKKEKSASVLKPRIILTLPRNMPSDVNVARKYTQTGALLASQKPSNIHLQSQRGESRNNSRKPSMRQSMDPDQEFANLVDV